MFNFILGGHWILRPWVKPVQMAQDPWGGRSDDESDNDKKNKASEGLPDLEEFFAKLLRRNSSGNKSPKRADRPPVRVKLNNKILVIGVIVLIVGWLMSGIYTVNERENGVETILGKYRATTQSGLNWNWPYPIGRVEKLDVQSVSTMRIGEFKTQKGSISTQDQREGQMLTRDENIVEIGAAVQYRISDARAYLYNAEAPVEILRDVVTSAVREVVGENPVDDVLTDRRNEWPQEAKQIIINTLQRYDIGIEVIAFELQDARAPAEVQDAFEDAVRAREDEERLRLEAEAYARERLPVARGDAARLTQSAQAYAVSVEADANAQTNRFNQLLSAYQKDKSALRTRLYLDTMNKIYSNARKVVVASSDTLPIINLNGAGNATVPLYGEVGSRVRAEDGKQRATEAHINNEPYQPSVEEDDELPLRTRDRQRIRIQ